MSQDLINAHGNISKLMPFLHLPVQSGSDRILKAMNRKHNRQEYIDIIANLRQARPDIGLSSDFIVGFPGESDEDFADTIDLVKKIGFTQCYSFKYSPRPGTPSADATNQVQEEVKEQRLAILQQLLSEQQVAFNQQFEGKKMAVLFEKESPKSKKQNEANKKQTFLAENGSKSGENLIQLWGKSPWLQSVVVEVLQSEAHQYLGKIAEVDIIKARPSSLVGKISNSLNFNHHN
jgi:tRNA-2-methylthio-N6-dimethylallyladenosine synthase